MNIQLKSLRVIDCGPLKDVCIDFTDAATGEPLPVTLIVGANGSGKTTILELITALAQVMAVRGEDEIVLQRARYAQADWIVDGVAFTSFYGERLSSPELAEDHYGQFTRSGKPPESQNGGNLAYNMMSLRMHQSDTDIPFVADWKVKAGQVNTFTLPSVLYFPFDRILVPVQGNQLYREETKYEWVHRYETVRSFKGSLSSYLVWLEYSDPRAFEQVRSVLNRIAGGNKTFEIDRKNLRAVVRTSSGDTHDLSLLSSGEQNLLILLLELRRRLLPGSIVLIDEIENSLHPAFQHRIAQALLQLQEEVPFQLIATTHAETFVDVFGTKATRVLPVAPLAVK